MDWNGAVPSQFSLRWLMDSRDGAIPQQEYSFEMLHRLIPNFSLLASLSHRCSSGGCRLPAPPPAGSLQPGREARPSSSAAAVGFAGGACEPWGGGRPPARRTAKASSKQGCGATAHLRRRGLAYGTSRLNGRGWTGRCAWQRRVLDGDKTWQNFLFLLHNPMKK
uniref:Uncharacterized protein n=1 Tax=Setaria viridis TaxID=4556 RepID=A0A4U6UHW0_SETVI|nr:hypothetical protein SEVIR_6G097600v2 [Setaria viridis]